MRLVKHEGYLNGRHYIPNKLCEKFLSLNPRPTGQELYEALYPLGGYDIYKHRFDHFIPDPDPNRPKRWGKINLKSGDNGWIENPDREGWLKWNPDPNFKSDWLKTVEEDIRLRREAMKKTIESRGEEVPKEKTLEQQREELQEQLKSAILEAGKALEADQIVPTNKICEKLKHDFQGHLSSTLIENWCPPEWKERTEKDELIENAVLKMGKLLEKDKGVPKNKICEKIKERFGSNINESDIEKFSLPEWKE